MHTICNIVHVLLTQQADPGFAGVYTGENLDGGL